MEKSSTAGRTQAIFVIGANQCRTLVIDKVIDRWMPGQAYLDEPTDGHTDIYFTDTTH